MPEFGPTEDLLLRVLRGYFYGDPHETVWPGGADVPEVGSLLPDDTRYPTVLIRRDRRSGSQNIRVNSPKHMQAMVATFETFTRGDNADSDGALLQEAVRQCLQSAVDRQAGWSDLGYLNSMLVWSQPARVSDYATSTGVVQYASLPSNVVRYESIYQFVVRPVVHGATGNRFVNL